MSTATFALNTTDDAAIDCFHCGLAFRPGKPFRVFVDGANRDMCCAGCAAVAETIVAGGLTYYYRHRNAPSGRPEDLVPAWLEHAERYDLDGVRNRFVQTDAAGLSRAELLLEGMTCPACAWLAEQQLRKIPGVSEAVVNFGTQRAHVGWHGNDATLADILRGVARVGLKAMPFDAARRTALRSKEKRQRLFELAVAGLGMMQVMMYAVPVYLAGPGEIDAQWISLMQWASLALTIPVVVFSARTFFARAWRDLSNRQIGMDVPIALAVAGAFAASVHATFTGDGEVYFDSVTMFVFLLLGARYLEAESRARAVIAIERLGHAPPATALIARGFPGSHATEAVASVKLVPGDVVLVETGAIIPADGCIAEGAGEVSEAVITGESIPLLKRTGDAVVGGSGNAGSPLYVQVSQVGANTVLAHIVRLTARALAEKPTMAQLADRVASRFSVAVLVLAGATVLVWLPDGGNAWFRYAIAVLVVTCPCALALATPSALTAATGRLSAIGLLVTRGHAVETLSRITDVVFDKTGTLTRNEMRVSLVTPLGMPDHLQVIAIAAALEQGSPHPLAHAITRAAQTVGADAIEATSLAHTTGQGIEGWIDGECYRIGTAAYVGLLVGKPLDQLLRPSESRSGVLLGRAGTWLAWIELDDPLREDAQQAVNRLEACGLRVHLVSGDMPAAVLGVARSLGISEERVRAGALPQRKLDYVAALQAKGCVVAMVGDGINDAPVLARADLSVAMGGGTDLARADADTVLLSGRLEALAEGVDVGRATRIIVRQNLAWAIAYNAMAVPLAMFGLISPWVAALGMSSSSLLVVANAARLHKKTDQPAAPASGRRH